MRWLLVPAAWGVWRDRGRASAQLRAWANALAARRGTRVTAVALARRLAGVRFALWRDGTVYDAQRFGRRASPRAAAGSRRRPLTSRF